MYLIDFLVKKGYAIDRTQCKRFILQNTVTVDGQWTDCGFVELVENSIVVVETRNLLKVHKYNA